MSRPRRKAQTTRFGAFRYHTTNLGDEIQTLAAMQFLPRVDKWIDRDRLGCTRLRGKISIITNGWFLHNSAIVWGNRSHQILQERFAGASWLPTYLRVMQKTLWRLPYCWPPSPAIDPLLVSMHITGLGRASEVMTSPASLEYLRRHGPVGCRDYATRHLLESLDVDAYFSGCLTMTLQRPDVVRTDHVIITDVPGIGSPDAPELSPVPDVVKRRLLFLSHYTRALNLRLRLQRARSLLQEYAAARLVITSRLHCALPCAAMGTPVLLVVGGRGDPRFGGLTPYLNVCSRPELRQWLAAIDWADLPTNPKSPAPLADALAARCKAFVTQRVD